MLPAIGMLWLTGCVTGNSNVSVCPVPVTYTAAFQHKLADEIEKLPPGAALTQAMLDYGRERAELRACRR